MSGGELTRRGLLLAGPALGFRLEEAVLDVRAGAVRGSLQGPLPVGSIQKVFLALAVGGGARSWECTGRGCWRRHGRVDLAGALRDSCNGAFREWAQAVDLIRVNAVMRGYGLAEVAAGQSFWGEDSGWRPDVGDLLRAFERVVREGALRGALVEAGRTGTAAALGREVGGYAVAAKTGTAVCVHRDRADGDGLVVAAGPAEAVRWVLLMRGHGVTGSRVAGAAGIRMRELLRG
jgi:cell division protein FtsI/penicillin-binding protein 2